MTIKNGDINPLNVHGLRILKKSPPHFTVVPFELRTEFKKITDWIYENLEGRFWAGQYYTRTDDKITVQAAVSFENPAEASYFLMFLNELNQR